MQKVQRWSKVFILFTLLFFSMGYIAQADEFKSVLDMYEEGQNKQSVDTENQTPVDEREEQQDTTITDDVTNSSNVGVTAWDFIKMILATVFVVGLLYFVLRFINRRSTNFNDSKTIQNLGGTSLGTNRSVQIVRVGKRLFIVGVGENVQLLKEIDDEEEFNEIISQYNEKMEQMLTPTDLVTKLTKLFQKNKATEENEETTNFSSTFKKQLERISKERKKFYEEMEKKGSDKQ